MSLSYDLDKDEVLVNKATTFELELFSDGSPAVISDAEYQIKDHEGDIITSGAAAVNGNKMSIVVAATVFTSLQEDCSLICDFLVNDKQEIITCFFDVVKYSFINPVSDSDLTDEYPDIQEDLWEGQDTYQKQTETAFQQVKDDIKRFGNRPYLIIDSRQIKPLVVLKAFEVIFRSFMKKSGDPYKELLEDSKDRYAKKLRNTSFRYDSDKDGLPDQTRKVRSVALTR